MATESTKLLYKPSEAAELLSMSQKALWLATFPRGGLVSTRIGRSVRYSRAALDKFIVQQSVCAK